MVFEIIFLDFGTFDFINIHKHLRLCILTILILFLMKSFYDLYVLLQINQVFNGVNLHLLSYLV